MNSEHNPIPAPASIPVERPLSRQAQAAIEAHYVEIVELKSQRDKALEENDKAKELCVQASHEINALKTDIADLKSKCIGYQLERDSAVAKFAALEGFFISLLAQMKAHKIPDAPPQTVAHDAEAPILDFSNVIPRKEKPKQKPISIHETQVQKT